MHRICFVSGSLAEEDTHFMTKLGLKICLLLLGNYLLFVNSFKRQTIDTISEKYYTMAVNTGKDLVTMYAPFNTRGNGKNFVYCLQFGERKIKSVFIFCDCLPAFLLANRS
jgi:hypothetical protein